MIKKAFIKFGCIALFMLSILLMHACGKAEKEGSLTVTANILASKGPFTSSFNVTLTAFYNENIESTANIYFSKEGKSANPTYQIYTTPIEISQNTSLKFYATFNSVKKEGGVLGVGEKKKEQILTSETYTEDYLFQATPTVTTTPINTGSTPTATPTAVPGLTATPSTTPTATPTSTVTPSATTSATPVSTPTPSPTPTQAPAIILVTQTGNTGTALTSSTITLNLTNNGVQNATNISLTGIVAPLVNTSNTCTSGIAAGGTCTFTLTYTPASVGSISITSTVNYNNGIAASSTNYTITASSTATTVAIGAQYSSNGAKWNDYVIYSSGVNGGDRYMQMGDACLGTENFYSNCIHGGEIRQASLPDLSSCTGVTVVDNLGAFNWICKNFSGNIYAVSTGLKAGKSLADLLDANGFKQNYIQVANNDGLVYQSTPAVWWSNTVEALPSNTTGSVIDLSTASKIYILTESRVSAGYNINADKVALVGLPGTKLSWYDGGTNCSAVGESSAVSQRCLIAAGSQKFIWIEGNFDAYSSSGTKAQYGIFMYSNKMSRFTKINISNATVNNFQINSVSSSLFNTIGVYNATSYGMEITSSSYYNVFSGIKATNSILGIKYNPSHSVGKNNIFTNILTNSNMSGFSCSFCYHVTVHGISAINNNTSNLSGTSIMLQGGDEIVLTQALSANSAGTGLFIEGTSFKGAQLVLAHHNKGIVLGTEGLSGLTTGHFSQNLLLGSNSTNCAVSSTSSAAGINAACGNTDGSNASIVTNLASLSGSIIVNAAANPDTANTSDNASGSAAYAATLDWFNYDSWYRWWGKWTVAGSFPNSSQREGCTSGTCQILDAKLQQADTLIYNRSNNYSAANSTFTVGQACPAAVHGDKVMSDYYSNTYLTNAYEILTDNVGDDDGLCESNEACIYMPNFGAYQGHGSLTSSTCTFTNATVTGVQMYAYTLNGG